MSQHISRKELKQDQFRETLAHGAEAVIGHQRIAGILVGAVVVVVLAVFGWRLYSEHQSVQGSQALEEAMKIFQARIRAPGEAAEPGEVTYVEEKYKYQDAAQKLAEVARKYSRTRPGQMAHYYAALSLERLGRYDDARKELKPLEGGSGELAALARFQLAEMDARTGKGDEAVKIFRQLAEKPTTLVPKPLVLLNLADTLSKTNPQEAARLYDQIKKDFPDSPIADEAEKRLENLSPKI